MPNDLPDAIHQATRLDPVWKLFQTWVAGELFQARERLEAATEPVEVYRAQGELAVWRRMTDLEHELRRQVPIRTQESETG